jgi:hypothetical protein
VHDGCTEARASPSEHRQDQRCEVAELLRAVRIYPLAASNLLATKARIQGTPVPVGRSGEASCSAPFDAVGHV